MPKKTRKMKQRAAMRRAYQAPGQEQQVEETTGETVETAVRMRPTTTIPSSRGVTPLTFDYTHIYGDLKRIAVFAGFFFAVLIALSFVIK